MHSHEERKKKKARKSYCSGPNKTIREFTLILLNIMGTYLSDLMLDLWDPCNSLSTLHRKCAAKFRKKDFPV